MLGGDRPDEILHPSCWDFEKMHDILAPAQALVDQQHGRPGADLRREDIHARS